MTRGGRCWSGATPLLPWRKSPPPPIVPVEAVAQEGKLTLSVQEAAEELGVCSKTVYNLIHRADFPVLRIGTRVRISRAGLAAWVQANTQKNIMEVS